MNGKPFEITPALVARVRALREYGLSLRAIATRLSIAESTAHKIAHSFRTCADCGESIPADQTLCNCNTSGDLG